MREYELCVHKEEKKMNRKMREHHIQKKVWEGLVGKVS